MKALYIFLLIILTSCMPKETHILKSYDLSIYDNSKIKKINKIIKIKYPNSLGAIGGSKIYYKKDNITSYYLYNRWINSLNMLVYKDILSYLNKNSEYKVIGYDSGSNYDKKTEVNIIDFYHIIDGDNSYALITFDVNILSNNNRLIKKREFSYKINCDKNAQSFVLSAKKALKSFLEELKEEL